MDYTEKMMRCQGYMEALEEERRKIQVFHRELPLSLELITQAIDNCRQQLGTSIECEEQTSSEGPVLEEFIPLKRSSSSEEEPSHKPNDKCQKVDWLRSVQLWNQDPSPQLKEDLPRETSVIETEKNGGGRGAFHPFHRDKRVTTTTTTTTTNVVTPPSSAAQTAATSSTAETANGNGGNSRREEKEGQSNRKARRSWSPELHRRFLHALQQLGGSHAATPKQIRELMKVDGLTNDEVKSHLQKYRLHTRRPSPAIHNNGNPQPPQFVVVGGIWVPPPEYAAMAATTGEATRVATNGIYAPVATAPPQRALAASCSQQQQQKQSLQSPTGPLHSEGRSSRAEHSIGDGDAHSSSPTTSSSTHTTTASPSF